MRHFALFLLAFIAICVVGSAAGETPLLNAKIGDWVETKAVAESKFQKSEQVSRLEIIKVGADEITVKTEVTIDGTKMPAKEVVTPLTPGTGPTDPGSNRQLLEEGNETIQAAGRAFDCHKRKYVVTTEINGKTAKMTFTDWLCPEVPVNQRVKVVIQQQFGEAESVLTEELVKFGRGN